MQHLKSLLPSQKNFFLLLFIKSDSMRNRFHSLTTYSHYLTNPRPILLHAFHFTHLNQPLKYTTLLHYSHIPKTLIKLPHLVHRHPNIRPHSILFLLIHVTAGSCQLPFIFILVCFMSSMYIFHSTDFNNQLDFLILKLT